MNRIMLLTILLVPVSGFCEPPPPPPMPAKAVISTRIIGDRYPQKVTTRREQGQVIEEYRIKGHLTMVKISPKTGKPYYIYYNDGWSGATEDSDLHDGKPSYWKIFSW